MKLSPMNSQVLLLNLPECLLGLFQLLDAKASRWTHFGHLWTHIDFEICLSWGAGLELDDAGCLIELPLAGIGTPPALCSHRQGGGH